MLAFFGLGAVELVILLGIGVVIFAGVVGTVLFLATRDKQDSDE